MPAADRIGRYQLLEKIGGGGMGVVYRARHVELQKTVALKLIHPDKGQRSHLVARFRREMEAAGKLDDPHVVRATDAGQEGDTLFLAMEFVEGMDLDKLLQVHGPLAVHHACELIHQAALGLEAIRLASMVHRDVKPSNLILSSRGVVKILDVGLALFRNDEVRDDLTPDGSTLGTADYLAPEQAGDSKQVDIRADIYSLGCTMYKLLAGRAPYQDARHPTWGAKLSAHLLEPLPPMQGRGDVPPAVQAILARMTAKHRDDRYATPADLAEALKPWARPADIRVLMSEESLRSAVGIPRAEAETPLARGSTVPATSIARTGANRWMLGGAVAVCVASAIAAVWVWFNSPPPMPIARVPDEQPVKIAPKIDAMDAIPNLDDGAVGWRPLLDRAPKPLLWKTGDGSSNWQLHEGLQQLNVFSSEPSLLAFGTTRGPSYSLQVGFAQPRWTDGAGIFWGYREVNDEYRSQRKLPPTYRAFFQYLRFESRTEEKGEVFSLVRGRGHVVEEAGGRLRTSRIVASVEDVRFPEGEQMLEIVVENQRLRRVRFGGADATKHVAPESNKKFDDADYVGPFGVFSTNVSCMYRNARFNKHD
ncbi:MAG: protein kinase [Gemmataceae bacterium]